MEVVRLGDICDIVKGSLYTASKIRELSKKSRGLGQVAAFTCGKEIYFLETDLYFDGEFILINTGGSFDIRYYKGKMIYVKHMVVITRSKGISLYKLFLYLKVMQKKIKSKYWKGSGIKHIRISEIMSIEIDIDKVKSIGGNSLFLVEEIASVSNRLIMLRETQREYYLNRIKEGLV